MAGRRGAGGGPQQQAAADHGGRGGIPFWCCLHDEVESEDHAWLAEGGLALTNRWLLIMKGVE
eukprot:scaffold19243_cov14-Tisochrysis_lutea.AAC.2